LKGSANILFLSQLGASDDYDLEITDHVDVVNLQGFSIPHCNLSTDQEGNRVVEFYFNSPNFMTRRLILPKDKSK